LASVTYAESISVKEKKEKFLNTFVPAVTQVYDELNQRYKKTEELLKKNPKNPEIVELMKIYHAKDSQDLLTRLKPHPISVTLAQAAMETGWGTSRLFKIANNAFGVWSFSKNEPRVPAFAYRNKKQVYLRKYESVADSIRHYYKTIATVKVFSKFRAKTMKTLNPYTLVKELDKYSERRYVYTRKLASIIKYNKFLKYDK